MAKIDAIRVSLEEMKMNEPSKRRRVNMSGRPYTYVFGRKLYICKADIKIFRNCHFTIYFNN